MHGTIGENNEDHPRVCGEHAVGFGMPGENVGSSPRMRGALCWLARERGSPGIIPAYAGSTRFPAESRSRSTDHPRVCGEHLLGMPWRVAFAGSSPRKRGAHPICMEFVCQFRIIPAYAGSTGRVLVVESWPWDHPRVCGEHYGGQGFELLVQGSSPRMRGARREPGGWRACGWIIPAYAGSTMYVSSPAWSGRDHPRGCGEHHRRCPAGRPSCGSSPRMRGARQQCKGPLGRMGIIPAYAGSTTRKP